MMPLRYRPSYRSEPYTYRPHYLRHLHNLAISGFYARDLDADDHEFLEYVRTRGIANGSLANSNADFIEEREFWAVPYALDPSVTRRAGPVHARVATPEEEALRQARSRAWLARRKLREQDKKLAAAELEREQREWKLANAERKRRDALSDAEWDAAAPKLRSRKRAKFGKTVDRHHVPQWRVDELAAPEIARLAEIERQKAAIAKEQQERKEQEARLAEAARMVLERTASIARAERKVAREQQRRREVIEEARRTVARVDQLEREWQGREQDPVLMKRAIDVLLRSTPGRAWTAEELMRATGCDRAFLVECVEEMVRNGTARKVDLPPEAA
jgi:hypothetical protein